MVKKKKIPFHNLENCLPNSGIEALESVKWTEN